MSIFKIHTAKREKVKLMVGLTGPSGAGKTYSGLLLAHGITQDWSKIIVADTENKSALYYASEDRPFGHIDFSVDLPNAYHPKNWVDVITEAENNKNCEVLILDSITHEWQGKDGCLDLVSNSSSKSSYTAWKDVTPLHDRFIDKMRNSRLHIIATMRSKMDHVIEKDDRGRGVPKRVGLKSMQREGAEYEFGIIFDIDISHYASVSKDRTGVFSQLGTFQIGEHTGAELLQWANSGADNEKKTAPGAMKGAVYEGSEDQKKVVRALYAKLSINDSTEKKEIHNALINYKIPCTEDFLESAIKQALGELRESGSISPIPF